MLALAEAFARVERKAPMRAEHRLELNLHDHSRRASQSVGRLGSPLPEWP
jgi:hypothetical protein